MQDFQGIATDRAWVVPAFSEAELEISHRRTLDRDLSVMPLWPRPIDGRHRLMLRIAEVIHVVAPAVTQIDSTDKRDIVLSARRMADQDQLLVMRAAQPH